MLTAGYGADGLRAWKQTVGGRTYFLYDGLTPVCETDASGNVTAVNTWGANGLLARHTTGSVFYCFDPQGSVSVRLDSSGNILSSHCNEAWGTQVSVGSGYASDPYAGYGGQWGYYRDSETGLHLLGHRYYDTSSGRFLNRDPMKYRGGVNLYAYCRNRPSLQIDVTGFQGQGIPFNPLGGTPDPGGTLFPSNPGATWYGPNNPAPAPGCGPVTSFPPPISPGGEPWGQLGGTGNWDPIVGGSGTNMPPYTPPTPIPVQPSPGLPVETIPEPPISTYPGGPWWEFEIIPVHVPLPPNNPLYNWIDRVAHNLEDWLREEDWF